MELGLPIRQHVAHALDAHSRFRLEAGKLGDALLERLAMTTAQRVHPQRDRACYGRHGDNNQNTPRAERRGSMIPAPYSDSTAEQK
jgi:hypothetical protein